MKRHFLSLQTCISFDWSNKEAKQIYPQEFAITASLSADCYVYRFNPLQNDRFPTLQSMPIKYVNKLGVVFNNSMLHSDIVF